MPDPDEALEARWLNVSNRLIEVFKEEHIEVLEAWFIIVNLADNLKKQFGLNVPEMPKPPESLM